MCAIEKISKLLSWPTMTKHSTTYAQKFSTQWHYAKVSMYALSHNAFSLQNVDLPLQSRSVVLDGTLYGVDVDAFELPSLAPSFVRSAIYLAAWNSQCCMKRAKSWKPHHEENETSKSRNSKAVKYTYSRFTNLAARLEYYCCREADIWR